jgi:hypothetical protein
MTFELQYYGVPVTEQRDLETRPEFTAAGGQITFSMVYRVGYLDVYRNGIKLALDEFTATNGTSFTLTTACTAGEKVQGISRRQVALTDIYTQSQTNTIANKWFGIATGSGDAAVVNTNPSIGFTLADGTEVQVRWPGSNTLTVPTINVNATGVVQITDSKGLPLSVSALANGQELLLRYNITSGKFRAVSLAADSTTKSGLTNLLYPSADGGWRDIYRAGWVPSFFNQQWGGAQWGTELVDGATGNLYKFDVATGFIDVDTSSQTPIANNATNTLVSMGFKVSDNMTLNALWAKLTKVGNPANLIQCYVYSDNGSGKPNAILANGTATTISGKVITSKSDGEFYRFSFSTSPTLVAGTQYHMVLKSSGAVDASNYWFWDQRSNSRYPNGFRNIGDATPTWTSSPATLMIFLVEAVTNNQFLQPSGQFDSKLIFSEGSPINQSKSLVQPLTNFYDGTNFTALYRVSNAVRGKPIADFVYGLDHSRIQISVGGASGAPIIRIYDKNRVLTNVIGTRDVSSVLNSNTRDIGVIIRTAGDGLDYAQIWVDGTLETEVTGQTFSMEPELKNLGSAWIGGGFPGAPVWTQDLQMTSLPSAQGWAYTNTGSLPAEANTYSIQNGKLIQNKNGFGAGDAAYYSKTTTLDNAVGWTIALKLRAINSNNVLPPNSAEISLRLYDGTKSIQLYVQEYFCGIGPVSGPPVIIQEDFKSKERIIMLTGKGSDYYLYVDGKLVIDGTGLLTQTTTTNSMLLGDIDSGYNGDAVYSYFKYYQGGMISPQASTGMSLHEAGYWSGNKSNILPALYNSGFPQSIKNYYGTSRNYTNINEWIEERKPISSSTTTTSNSAVVCPEMEMFALGDVFDCTFFSTVLNSTLQGASVTIGIYCDGSTCMLTGRGDAAVANSAFSNVVHGVVRSNLGLHKLEGRYFTSSGTASSYGLHRNLKVKNFK